MRFSHKGAKPDRQVKPVTRKRSNCPNSEFKADSWGRSYCRRRLCRSLMIPARSCSYAYIALNYSASETQTGEVWINVMTPGLLSPFTTTTTTTFLSLIGPRGELWGVAWSCSPPAESTHWEKSYTTRDIKRLLCMTILFSSVSYVDTAMRWNQSSMEFLGTDTETSDTLCPHLTKNNLETLSAAPREPGQLRPTSLTPSPNNRWIWDISTR